ncbi:MAG TPA: ABC transporter permease [Gemmatimonadaceae bacterium]|nr:ABC transporter permease [Gemmatimonadaceae bacterium]
MSGEPPRRTPFRLGVGPRRVERDVDEELAFHLEMRARRLAARGLDPDRARAEALRQFGDLGAVRAECLDIDHRQDRTMRRVNFLGELRQDVGYALRALRQHAGFSAVVLATLAIGIGANAAVFSVVDALLLRPLPVAHPEQLVSLGDPRRVNSVSSGSPRTDIFSYRLYTELRDRNHVVSGLLATGRANPIDVLVEERAAGGAAVTSEPEHPRGRFVSGNYFDVLGVHAALGRTFAPDEGRTAGDAPVVVISHAYWTRRFDADSGVLGRTLRINEAPYTIVGVAPEGFAGEIVGQPTDLWLPLTMQPVFAPNRPWLDERDVNWLLLVGRLKPGVTPAQAEAEFSTLAEQAITAQGVRAENLAPSLPGGLHVEVVSAARGLSSLRDVYDEALVTLMAAVALVLLIVCANVANLLLVRATSRGREMSVRIALGAGRGRILRQLVTESLLLAVLGGALGLVVATWGRTLLLRLASSGRAPIPLDARFDWRVLAFTGALVLVTALLFGLAPALHATRVQVAEALRSQARGLTGGARGRRPGAGRVLVVAQVALSLMLLVATSLLARSVRRLAASDIGVARGELLIASVDAARTGYEGDALAALLRDVLARARALPGVATASFSENGLFAGTESSTTLQVEGFTPAAAGDTLVNYDRVGPDYFHAIGARLLRGRDVQASDDEHAPKVGVVNETMARFYFPDGDAIGRYVRVDGQEYRIVGVVADVQDHGLRDAPVRRLYLPAFQVPEQLRGFNLELRGPDPARLVTPTRNMIGEANAALVAYQVSPLDDLLRASIRQDLLVARMVSAFGVLALALAALGLYGVMTYTAMRRTSEFGLRLALGAQRGDVGRLVLGEALRLVAAGAALGLPLALAATRLLRSQLFEVAPFDPVSIAVALGVLLLGALLAGWLPARRATRVAPLVALRTE